jgi:23S rRNA (guanosine2251-2'-O)-methyltransferase
MREPDALVLALDQIQDPQNLGAACRSAEAAGASGVVIPERRAASVTPATCKASAGAVEHLPVARVRNVADWLGEAKRAHAWVYGAAAEADRDYTDVDWTGRAMLVLGSEGSGLRPRVASACDELISIPAAGRVASLNASVAAAVILFEARRQRTSAGAP